MATILPFIQRTAGRARPSPAGGTAAIVFFTGVRYERPVADTPAEAAPQKTRRTRRRATNK